VLQPRYESVRPSGINRMRVAWKEGARAQIGSLFRRFPFLKDLQKRTTEGLPRLVSTGRSADAIIPRVPDQLLL